MSFGPSFDTDCVPQGGVLKAYAFLRMSSHPGGKWIREGGRAPAS